MTRRIAFLVFPGFQLLDACGPVAAFEIAGRYRPDAYDLRLIAAPAGLIKSSSGVAIQASAPGQIARLDTLIVAGGDGTREAARDPRLQRLVRACARQARRIASVCSGAYVLAEAGLLEGRSATTHWSRSGDFARRYPGVRLQPDRIFIKDGKVWTSAGISAGIDLSLALIEEDVGERIARQVARQLVVYYRRPGGQSQFSALLEMERGGGRFAGLLDHVRGSLRARHSVSELAERACMSPRHFARAFQAETGVSPARAVARLRAETARAALERGTQSVSQVARACGFEDPERMRRTFLRLFGTTPSSLKRPAAARAL